MPRQHSEKQSCLSHHTPRHPIEFVFPLPAVSLITLSVFPVVAVLSWRPVSSPHPHSNVAVTPGKDNVMSLGRLWPSASKRRDFRGKSNKPMGRPLRDTEECAWWGSWKGGELWVPRALEEAVATGGPAHRRER